MKNNIIYTLILLLGIGMTGCKENEALEYMDEPSIYFLNNQMAKQQDSIEQSFFVLKDSQVRDTIFLDIRTMGYTADSPRPIKLIVTNDGKPGAAVAGVHYVAFDDPEIAAQMAIPRNAVKAMVPIILKRDPSLNDMEHGVRLELAIGENEYFRPGIDKWTKFVIKSTALPSKPVLWDTYWKYYFGTAWGPVKMKFIIDYVGFAEFGDRVDSGYSSYLNSKARQKLLEYNNDPANNPPLKEKDGTLVEF